MQFIGKLPTNYLCVFDHFVKLALKGLWFTRSNVKQRGIALWMADKWRSQSPSQNDLVRSLRAGVTSSKNLFQYRNVEVFWQPCWLNWSNLIFRWVISVSHLSHVCSQSSWSGSSASNNGYISVMLSNRVLYLSSSAWLKKADSCRYPSASAIIDIPLLPRT